jgi:hypothetical protein
LVEQRIPGERVRIEHVREGPDGSGELHELIAKSPFRDVVVNIESYSGRDVRRSAGLDGR